MKLLRISICWNIRWLG